MLGQRLELVGAGHVQFPCLELRAPLCMGHEHTSALLVVSEDGLSSSLWQQAVVGFGHQSPLGRLYLFFEARSREQPSPSTTSHTGLAQAGGEASDRQLVRLATRCFQCIANEVRPVGTGRSIGDVGDDSPLPLRRRGWTWFPSFPPLAGLWRRPRG